MASINVGKDPYPCFCGGSRTYEICETPSDYFFFKVPVPELVKKYPRYKTIVCDNCGNVQVLLIKSWQKYKYKYKYYSSNSFLQHKFLFWLSKIHDPIISLSLIALPVYVIQSIDYILWLLKLLWILSFIRQSEYEVKYNENNKSCAQIQVPLIDEFSVSSSDSY